MYCSSCGLELPHELTYCSRCGNNLRPVNQQPAEGVVRHKGAAAYLTAAVVMVTLGGFFATLTLVITLISRGVDLRNGGGALAAGLLLTILALDWALIRLLTRVLQLGPAARIPAAPKILPEPVQARRLDEPRPPVTSVTDHTTRTLPPVYVERNEPK